MEEYIENERFNAAKEKIIGKKHNDKGIGTLSEKTVHGVLKHFLNPMRIAMKWHLTVILLIYTMTAVL